MATKTETEGGRTIWAWAEEAAERAMKGVEATPNEYRRAEEDAPSSEIADASDVAGG
jgi:hypothetical protein